MQDLWNPLFVVAAIVSLSFMLRYSKNVEQEKAISLLNENNRLLRELIAELREARQDSGVVIDRDRISNWPTTDGFVHHAVIVMLLVLSCPGRSEHVSDNDS
jgi:uncharacterized ion transporter superfamily protein YfcC